MKRIISLLPVLVSLCSFAQYNVTQFVNPIIGTGGHGHTFPGATLPFAMVQLSPDTRIDGSWDGCSGYHYSDTLLYGFSHTHLSGTGCSDYGDIAFMPTFVTKPLAGIESQDNLSSKFDRKSEISKAGYYSLTLVNGIKVELTSTLRVGLQQYTYSQNGYAWITLNLKHRDELLEGKITQINPHTFSGLRRSKAWAENQLVFYYFEINRDADQIIISKNSTGQTKVNLGYKVKAGDKILVKTALSSVDEIGAQMNLQRELPHWNFDKVKQDANQAWNKELNKIAVFGGTKNQKINFYSALYHCMIHPNIMNDADGRYMGRDKQIHLADSFKYYTVFSLWDTYRALHPLLNLIDKKRSRDFIKTFQAQYEQSGRLPMWELWGNETNCMIGFHSVSVILDAFNKGVITLGDLKAIYPAVKAEAMSNRFGLDKYREKGYLSIEDESESVSKTLEYSYDFFCVSQIAMNLLLYDDAAYFKKLGQGWRNVYDVKNGFMTPRKNGGWLSPFDPKRVDNNYTEANAWQYSFAVPHEAWLVKENVSALFNADSKTTGREQSDITGLIGQYAQGNEPSHHIPYLFGSVDSTSKYVTKIMDELYYPAPDGLCGNEDCGQMSAWYVFSSMGIYPAEPYRPYFAYGNMLFDSVKITSDNYSFSIFKDPSKATNNPKYRAYLEKNYSEFGKSHGVLVEKNNLPLIIGFDSFENALEAKKSAFYFPSPIIDGHPQLIEDSISITLHSNFKDELDPRYHKILYQLNSDKLKEYLSPFFISKNTRVSAFESMDLEKLKDDPYFYRHTPTWVADTSKAFFYKKPNNYSITLQSVYSKQYDADGAEGLIDGQMGEADWRKGRWQGYQGQNFEAVVNLKEDKMIKTISLGFLQDTRAWIVLPKSILVYGSSDGINYTKLVDSTHAISANIMDQFRNEFTFNIKPQKFKTIKIKAINYGKLPDWHMGRGGDSYIFIDEIKID